MQMGGPQRQLWAFRGVENEIDLKEKWSNSKLRMADLRLQCSNLKHEKGQIEANLSQLYAQRGQLEVQMGLHG